MLLGDMTAPLDVTTLLENVFNNGISKLVKLAQYVVRQNAWLFCILQHVVHCNPSGHMTVNIVKPAHAAYWQHHVI